MQLLAKETKVQSVAIQFSLVSDDESEPSGLEPELVVDGRVLTAFEYGPVDLSQLDQSLRGDGTYFVWTCECGDPGCAGYFEGVEVRHRDGCVDWKSCQTRYSFYADELRQAMADAVSECRRMLAENPKLELLPAQNREFLKKRRTRNSI
jgi:hypothetical protein